MHFQASETAYQYLAGLVCQLTISLAGSTFVCLEPYTLKLQEGGVEGLSLTPEEVSWLVAVVELGCLIGPPISSRLANSFGRKPMVFSTGPICLLGWVLMLLTRNFTVLLVVRLLQGILSGIMFTITPIYTAEISEPKHRGRISGLFNVFWYLGVVYSYVLGHFLSFNNYILASLLLPLIFTFAFPMFPETPYYLLMKNRPEEAANVLRALRNSGSIEAEFAEMKKSVEEEMKFESSWKALFLDPRERRAFIVLQIASFTKILTGTVTILNYSSEMLTVGVKDLNPGETTIILGSLFCVLGFLPALLSDVIGRRCLLLASSYGLFFSHLITGTFFFVEGSDSIHTNAPVWVLFAGLFGYCFFYDIGLGSLTQTLQAEMFSAKTRGLAGSITQVIGGAASFLIILSYRPITENFGVYLNFWVYSGVGLFGGILLSFLMFETKGEVIGRMLKEKQDTPV